MSMRASINAARVSGLPARSQAEADPQSEAGSTTVFEFNFSADDPTFAGHFPGHPLLPGAFQLEMARAAMEWTLDCPLVVREVCRAKFLRPILPGEAVRLELKWSEADGMIQVQTGLSTSGQPAGVATLRLWRSAPN